MKHQSSGTPLLLAAVVFLVACSTEGEAPEAGAANAEPNVVAISATEYAIQAPDTIDAGWTTLRLHNRGSGIHYGHMVRIDSGRTVQDLVAAYAEAIRTSGPRPKWVMRFGGPGGTAPGDSSSVTQLLEPGNYVWICPVEDESGHPHLGKGETRSFVVRAAGANAVAAAAAPSATTAIRLMDFTFEVDSTFRSGRHTVRVENGGVEPHDLVVMKLAPGRTLEELAAAMNPEQARRDDKGGPPPSMESVATLAGGIAAIAPGMQSFFETNLTPGEYVFLCMATAPDGRSHIEHGMVRQVSVR